MLAVKDFFVVDDDGDVQPGATIQIWNESNGALAVPYADNAGATPKGNPFTAQGAGDPYPGRVTFYVVGGRYRIDATLGGFTIPMRDVLIGTAAGTDTPTGNVRPVTAAGAITVLPTDRVILVNKTVGEATTVNLGSAADRGGLPITIVDLKGDAATNNITPVFSGAETLAGLTGASFVIQSNGGGFTFNPKPDGSGWYADGNQL